MIVFFTLWMVGIEIPKDEDVRHRKHWVIGQINRLNNLFFSELLVST